MQADRFAGRNSHLSHHLEAYAPETFQVSPHTHERVLNARRRSMPLCATQKRSVSSADTDSYWLVPRTTYSLTKKRGKEFKTGYQN